MCIRDSPVCDESRPLPATDDSQLQRRQFWGRIFDTTSEDAALATGSNGEYDLTRNLGVLLFSMSHAGHVCSYDNGIDESSSCFGCI